jgi:aldehyde:ferredoxin oxidoreductase
MMGYEGSILEVDLSKDKSLQHDWDKMIDVYYAGMGWDSSGKPLPETLEKYGLGYIAKDLYQK